MPTYDYQCDANGAVLEVRHKMNDNIATWGQLCELAQVEPGCTPLDSPVRKLATGGQVVNSRNLGKSGEPPCGAGSCGMGGCGFNS